MVSFFELVSLWYAGRWIRVSEVRPQIGSLCVSVAKIEVYASWDTLEVGHTCCGLFFVCLFLFSRVSVSACHPDGFGVVLLPAPG